MRLHSRFLLYGLLITATWEGMLYVTVSGFNLRPYQLFLAVGLVLSIVRGGFAVGKIGVLLMLYVLVGVPGLINSVALADSLRTLFFSGLMVVITLTVRAFMAGSQRAFERGLWFWVLGVGSIVNAFGLLQVITWILGQPISPHFVPDFYAIYRPYSFFIEPNFYGNFLASQIVMMAVLIHSSKAKLFWPVLVPNALLALGLLAINQSRGPWIATILAILLFVVGRYLRRGFLPLRLSIAGGLSLIIGVAAFTSAVMLAPQLTDTFVQRLEDTINPLGEGAAQDRVADIMLSAATFRQHPWIGNGVGTWGHHAGREGRSTRTPPRNLVIAWLFEKGILGALTGVALVLAIIVRTIRALHYADHEQQLRIWALFLGWLSVFITFQFTVLEISPFYWILLGMLLAGTDLILTKQKSSTHVAHQLDMKSTAVTP